MQEKHEENTRVSIEGSLARDARADTYRLKSSWVRRLMHSLLQGYLICRRRRRRDRPPLLGFTCSAPDLPCPTFRQRVEVIRILIFSSSPSSSTSSASASASGRCKVPLPLEGGRWKPARCRPSLPLSLPSHPSPHSPTGRNAAKFARRITVKAFGLFIGNSTSVV